MARPKKVTLNNDVKTVEVIKEREEPKVFETDDASVEITETIFVEDKVPEMKVEMIDSIKHESDKTKLPTPICDIEELSDDDKQVLIEKKIKTIISQTQIPYIPALVRYREPGTTAVPPMYALVDYDHRFVNEGWEYYKTNVREPYVKDYLQLIAKLFNPHKIYTRLVQFNYE